MRYVICVIDRATGTGTPEERAAIDEFNDRLVADGHWVMAFGLAEPGRSVVIDGRGAEPTSVDGPLVDTPEYVSGMWIIDAPDDSTARSLAAEGSRCCNRRVELRAVLGG